MFFVHDFFRYARTMLTVRTGSYAPALANRLKYEELSHPKNQKMCDPILVLKMQPHYSQFSRENATPSSGTSPVAS